MVAGDEVQDRLKQLCEEHNLRYGIFWMDQNGVASYGTSYELPERMREMQQAGLPVYTIVSRNFSFARGEGCALAVPPRGPAPASAPLAAAASPSGTPHG
mmetsp:Transcript_1937/g.6929  ORF Transcript_1937/g.6929 Transcript_1937/m.6929 type:complete len:100 (-) Transcript_1937:730-1029(-)